MSVREMTDEEIDSFLHEHSVGILSLSSGNVSYGVPDSFGYDEGVLYFYFLYTTDSKKMQFVEATDIATMTIYDAEKLQSVVLSGALINVPKDEALVGGSIFARKTEFPTLDFNLKLDSKDCQYAFYKLPINEASGRSYEVDF